MKFQSILAVALLATTVVTACQSKPKTEAAAPAPVHALPATLEEAIASTTYRSAANTPRDQYRHPLETLNFFGIKPEMTVVEISPGAGWYMEILAPYLQPKGKYIGAIPAVSPENTYATEMVTKATAWIKDRPELTNASLSVFSPPGKIEIAADEAADMIVTFRNVHNWQKDGGDKAAFKAFFKALKPGGILGVVEHRADAKANPAKIAKSGYVREKDVIRMAEKAGFKLEAKSEINANPKDTKDYPEGVWTLPPVLRLKEQDQAKYLAIGESDRMTLKFVKPIKKASKSGKKKKK